MHPRNKLFLLVFRFDDARESLLLLVLHCLELKVPGTSSWLSVRSRRRALAQADHLEYTLSKSTFSYFIFRCSFFRCELRCATNTTSWPNSFASWTNRKLQVCNFHSRVLFAIFFKFIWNASGTIYGKSYAMRWNSKIAQISSRMHISGRRPSPDGHNRVEIHYFSSFTGFTTNIFVDGFAHMPSVGVYDALTIISITSNERIALASPWALHPNANKYKFQDLWICNEMREQRSRRALQNIGNNDKIQNGCSINIE